MSNPLLLPSLAPDPTRGKDHPCFRPSVYSHTLSLARRWSLRVGHLGGVVWKRFLWRKRALRCPLERLHPGVFRWRRRGSGGSVEPELGHRRGAGGPGGPLQPPLKSTPPPPATPSKANTKNTKGTIKIEKAQANSMVSSHHLRDPARTHLTGPWHSPTASHHQRSSPIRSDTCPSLLLRESWYQGIGRAADNHDARGEDSVRRSRQARK